MTELFISHSSKDKAWAEQVREALRGEGYRSLFLDSHPDDGIAAGGADYSLEAATLPGDWRVGTRRDGLPRH